MSFKVTIGVFFDDLNDKGSSYVIDLSCSHFAVKDTHLMIKILNTVELYPELSMTTSHDSLDAVLHLPAYKKLISINEKRMDPSLSTGPLSQAPSTVYLPLPLLDSYLSVHQEQRKGKKERKGRYRFSKRILIPTKGRNGYHISLSSLS